MSNFFCTPRLLQTSVFEFRPKKCRTEDLRGGAFSIRPGTYINRQTEKLNGQTSTHTHTNRQTHQIKRQTQLNRKTDRHPHTLNRFDKNTKKTYRPQKHTHTHKDRHLNVQKDRYKNFKKHTNQTNRETPPEKLTHEIQSTHTHTHTHREK